MGWRQGTGDQPDDESDWGFVPSRQGANHGDDFDGDSGSPASDRGLRDERLAGFAPGGKWQSRPPSAALARVLDSVSGRERHCPGADYDEMVGMVRHWAAIESWAGAAKLGVIRELIRREAKPWRPTDQHVDLPDAWSESLTHELALALAASAGSADRTEWLAWDLGTRLPGIDALLTDGTLNYGKAKAIAEAFKHLSDNDAAHAQALILGHLAGKTYLQVLRLATMAASKVDPDGDERRRKHAEKQLARVRLWREQSGAVTLAGFDLPADEAQDTAVAAHAALPARVNLTIPRTDLQHLTGLHNLTGPASRGSPSPSPWAFVPRDGDHGPPGGFGTWTLTIPGWRECAVRLESVPTFECDHAHESHAYQANDALRHLVQIRDGDCTFPPCTRHARECDFEHAIPYHRGGRTCACNAGARSRKCHRIKQSPGWHVTQPKPGFHQWTTPSGRTYTQEPKRYPA